MLEDVEKNLEKHKIALEQKDKQLSDVKKILIGAQKSYDTVVSENKELKNTLKILNSDTNSINNSNKTNTLKEKEIILKKNNRKKYKNVVYEERK